MKNSNLDSREYQTKLKPLFFTDGEPAIRGFLTFIKTLNPSVQLVEEWSIQEFKQVLLDTEYGDLGKKGRKIRFRLFEGQPNTAAHNTATYKVVGRDRYFVQSQKTDSGEAISDADSKKKLEENIYPYHSLFTKQNKITTDESQNYHSLKYWCNLFPDIVDITDNQGNLVEIDHSYYARVGILNLVFSEVKVDATLELKYLSPDHNKERLKGVEFSWRYDVSDEAYVPKITKLMNNFFQSINISPWADLEAERTSCFADISLPF